jgi:transposase-like protein
MNKGKRDTYTSEFKLKVAIKAMSGDKTLAQLASEYHVHPSQITKWKEHLKGSASAVFGSPSKRKKRETITEASLMEKVGHLAALPKTSPRAHWPSNARPSHFTNHFLFCD